MKLDPLQLDPHQMTLAGRLIVLVTLVIVIGGTAATWFWSGEILPAGRYPIMLFIMPSLFVAGIFIASSMLCLKMAGLNFYQQGSDEAE